jgi:hypothetical protein
VGAGARRRGQAGNTSQWGKFEPAVTDVMPQSCPHEGDTTARDSPTGPGVYQEEFAYGGLPSGFACLEVSRECQGGHRVRDAPGKRAS